ncbi:unnamed protein product [Thelazia callipaeda]|uniref:DUF5872 domain-containing protein n=1 Tax=Thelazia callipaeda TaxID=103827 RepID=A0A0N5CJM7_THECL|nr:unnamed protein product [Thelazia callipaeda]
MLQTNGSENPTDQVPDKQKEAQKNGTQKSGTGKSRTKSSGSKRRKKKRREAMPEGFDQWAEVDQKYYQEISALLRDSKATRKQCGFTRRKIGAWKAMKLRWKHQATTNIEFSAYKKALKEIKPLDKSEQLDIDY